MGAGRGDFEFLAGNWSISHRRLKDGTTDEWEEFEGEATVWSALDGLASIEELRIPARGFSGMGVRVYDLAGERWADHWVSGAYGVVNEPMYGSFDDDGVGTFLAEEVEDGVTVIGRGVWDRITPTSCRWHQSSSRDGGVTWDHNWFMDWTKV